MTRSMGFWDIYRASLKPAEVEEPIDRWLHRPLGYGVARIAKPTPVSADMITVGSIGLGWTAAALLLSNVRHPMQLSALFLFLSAIFDCADGQLARMRGTSSVIGRMLDGVADLCVMTAMVLSCLYTLWRIWNTPLWLGVTVLALALVTVTTSSFHTAMYDHYKNVWLRFTSPAFKDGEDLSTAQARWQTSRAQAGWVRTFVWRIYLFYVKNQEDYVQRFDPYTVAALGQLPGYSATNEAIYRKWAAAPLAALRTWFGFGSLVFGLALSLALERLEAYLLFRLVVLNAIFYFYVRPLQRHASRRALEEMTIAAAAAPGATTPMGKSAIGPA